MSVLSLFEKEIENYYLSDNEIYVFQDEAESLKEVVPDVTKCDFTVYCYGKKAEVKSISDIMWNAKDAKRKGSYTFRVTAALDGKRIHRYGHNDNGTPDCGFADHGICQ